ncbi:peptide deformylase [Sinomonas halotolerans]|uniref:Peptide deformylase n=1 Tax=Sinomonas halotolerans TaxID=1644133 RepID=A0ABU9X1B7_9MICC
MAVLPIRIIGDPVLRTVAEPLTEFGPALRRLVEDMMETMEDVDGAGLAAPQVGVSLRVFTYQVDGVKGHVVNPQLVLSEDFQEDAVEGCLSIPGVAFPVRRRRTAEVRGVDAEGQAVSFHAEGLLSRCVQHETDHLDGVLFPDLLEGEDRKAALRTIRAITYRGMTEATTAQRATNVGSSFGAGSNA